MASLAIVVKFFGLAFSALLPLINPFGSALFFLGLVGNAPPEVYRALARKIAISTVLFLLAIDLVGTAILAFFGISIPVVQVAGGLILAAMGWSLLNQPESGKRSDEAEIQAAHVGPLEDQIFYPFTFPVTAGPGTVVVMLTLSAHASGRALLPDLMAHIGLLSAIVVQCLLVYFAYAYAPKITARLSAQTAHGILRIIAFVLLCIGVQITWNGAQVLLKTVVR